MKKRGFGAGKYNGFGGKVEVAETIQQAAIRELTEEAHISTDTLVQLGILEFEFIDSDEILETHIFKCATYSGTIGESEEMAPEWFEESKIPFEKMWKDDKYWFPLFLQNKKFVGRFVFDRELNVSEYTLKKVSDLFK